MALTDTKPDERTDVAKAAERIREITSAVASHNEAAARQINAIVSKYGKAAIETELGADGAALTKTHAEMRAVVKESTGKNVAAMAVK